VRFEYRILFGFLFALLLGISILNFVAIRMHKAELLSILYRDVHLHLELSEKVKGYKLPDYIKTSNRPLKAKDLVFYRIIGDKFVFLDFSRLRERLRAFALNLFLWEIFLILLLSFLFYRLLWHHLQERERNREFLELMLLVLSHRFGNFLATQRVNLEILKEGMNPSALGRLQKAYNYIEEEFRRTLELIRRFPTKGEKGEVRLDSLIQRMLKSFGEELEGKEVKFDLKEVKVRIPGNDLEMVLQLFLENATRYSKNFVRISSRREGQRVILEVENDLAPDVPRGSGLGLELARRLAERMGAKVEVHEDQGRFRQVISF